MGRKTFSLLVILATVLLAGVASGAQEKGAPQEKLGTVNFPVSCSPAASQQFERAVALLHSFWYEEASKAFTEVTVTDPSCAMGFWGVAMSMYYPLWYPPNEATLKAGVAALDRAKAAGAKTQRERDYITAIDMFYRDWDKSDHRSRTLAYEKAMERLYTRYPDDREAGIFYALALNATAPPTDKTYANQLKAAAILEKVLTEQPNHPGVAHYLIHSYDSATLASRGLPAARSYAKIAPSAPHALHMPGHIFTRLGLWQESIDSNRTSADAGTAYSARTGAAGVWDQTLHSLDYLVYAYLQTGRDVAAKRVADEVATIQKAYPESLAAAYALAAIPARVALERRRWPEATSVSLSPSTFPWSKFPWGEGIISFTRALGMARTGDVAGAEKEVDKLASLRDSLVQAKNKYWADQVEVQRRAALGVVARAQGKNQEALNLLRSAIDLESSMDKHPVTPAPVVPARELLGDLLLELNQPKEALAEFEGTLAAEPNRFRSLFGAGQAAELSGDAGKARALYTKVVALSDRADTERPEIKQAKAFLAK
jgi:tetratricopeptide (TPR) repeat protein